MKTFYFMVVTLSMISFSTASFGFRPPTKPRPSKVRPAPAPAPAPEVAPAPVPVEAPPVVEGDHGTGETAPMPSVAETRPEVPVEETVVKLATGINDSKSLVCWKDDKATFFINFGKPEVKDYPLGDKTFKVLKQTANGNFSFDIENEVGGYKEEIAEKFLSGSSLEDGSVKYDFTDPHAKMRPKFQIITDPEHRTATLSYRIWEQDSVEGLKCHFYQSEVGLNSKLEQPKKEETDEKKAEVEEQKNEDLDDMLEILKEIDAGISGTGEQK